jgi:hypothetical protein
MKTNVQVTILLFVATVLSSCRKDNIDQSYKECYTEITPESRAYFYDDAHEFGLQRLGADTLTDYIKNPVYREEQTLYVLGKLSAIYNESISTESPLHDLFFKYEIHKMLSSSSNTVGIRFSDFGLQKDFAKNPSEAQNEVLNDLINHKGFWLYEPSKHATNVYIKTDRQYVLSIIAYRLKGTLGVEKSWVSKITNFEFNDRDISYSWTEDYDEFIFKYGFDDCPSGCAQSHFWKIRVDQNCNVKLVEEYGDPIPE